MSDSDDDWFNKDENEILSSLQQQVEQRQLKNEVEEHIEVFNTTADDYARQRSREAACPSSSSGSKSTGRFSAAEFGKAEKMTPLEMFLYFMADERDLFVDQLSANDSRKRISQYVQILTTLSQLELSGFDEQLLSGVAKQTVLLQYIKHFAEKLFAPSSAENLDEDSEKLLRNIKWLLIRGHKLGVLDKLGYELIEYFKMLLAQCERPKLLQHPLCIEFSQELQVLPIVRKVKHEIYPKLEDLLRPEAVEVTSPAVPGDVAGYINRERQLLCEDFMHPLRELVQRLRNKVDVDSLIEQNLLWLNTEIILNPEFSEAERSSLIFMDSRPDTRLENCKPHIEEKYRIPLNNFKTGTMLCFTTSYDFDNLILAIVGYTDRKTLKEGYLSVEIAQQYNIGNIYGKRFIMFEAPVFFEPYLRVHNYLSTCSAGNFPMRRYIVDGEIHVRRPLYFKPDSYYMYNQKPYSFDKSPNDINLNVMQKVAFSSALTTEFSLIQGPPGTGKTHLSVELVNTLLQNVKRLKTGPIIVLTYTNDSLDKFLLKISKHTDSILRFGFQSRLPEIGKYNVQHVVDKSLVPPQLKRVWWLVQCEYKEQFQRLQALQANFDGTEEDYLTIRKAQEQLQLIVEKINTLRTIFQYHVAKDRSLLAMTTTCAARLNFLFRLLQSKCFVFEEAAEIAENHVLACLTPYTQHVILIGDHKQLKPYTGTHTLQDVQMSLFERLITHHFPFTMLNVQYRMRSCIAELLVPIFYDKLISDTSVNAYPNVNVIPTNIFFVDHNEPEKQLTDMSFVNQYEVQTVKSIIKKLKKYKDYNIVILTPYAAQVECLKKIVQNNILVSTVDSFQGLEADIVLLSLVRSNPSGQIGFLRQPNRVCVALSRARLALYMIGNMDTLQRGNKQLWGAINAKLQEQNAIGNEFLKKIKKLRHPNI